ncbi:Zinc finger, PHD-type,Zinc finger, FYVE/PHD-type,Spen paralogue and orthologue SPOC, C-terminal,Zinc [Cinara cedri]|uniref:Zinc finger, PHD-type,Zinc finger, FYVE/PHD-type,Spen paralogue and orthologue SPOC, C-terminal,Zinc n=1 Tax=Cinara cedri TaxID=506608 RepID=A0A5E4MD39_9HEMI|nr:Zinc finger, PHD-type,Zinc finger, FYVE/PHD-type,Spen paralogue and orthologue SPOC, C-terminal,Zinc [Cinara cedri]
MGFYLNMSCSKITEKADEESEDEAEDTLVVVVKPDGTVAIDQETFNRVLESKKETMNIIHFENSSNKGITTNPENGEQEINLTVQGFYPSISTKSLLSKDTPINEKSNLSIVYLDHCYHKEYPTSTAPENIRNTLSSGVNEITNKLTQSQISNEIKESTVRDTERELNDNPLSVPIEDIKSDIHVPMHSIIESNSPNSKKPLISKVNLKNEKFKPKSPVGMKNTIVKTKSEDIQTNQLNDTPRVSKTIKRLLPMKPNQVRPTLQIKNSRQKKSEVVVDPALLKANDMVRQSSIEPKKYIQNQIMFKKNKVKNENSENSIECLSTSQTQLLPNAPQLFSSPNIITDDNKSTVKTENENLDLKTNVIEKVDNTITIENSVLNVPINSEGVTVNTNDSIRVRKISNHSKDNPIENTVNKTVEDILNNISSQLDNQTEIINENNLIDELADLNEDLNSSTFVAPSNSSHDLMNKLLLDDSLNQSDKNDSKSSKTNDKSKGSTIIYGRSGRVVTLPPIEIPKTRSLVKKENANACMKDQVRQRRSSENSKSIIDCSEESDTDREGTMASEDDPNRLWCVCRKPHNNRFMICCDTCEDWFHGKCVGITKALGEQMESQGVEWNCPPCRKKKTEEVRKKAEEEKFKKKSEEDKKKKPCPKTSVTKISPKATKTLSQTKQNCIQCKKIIESVGMGLFCDEACLDKHIEDSVTAIKACCTSESTDIILFDKKNSRFITGEQAPKLVNLKQWMKENPAFQIMKPSGLTKSNSSKPCSKPLNNQKSPQQSILKFVKKENENRLKRRASSPEKHKVKEIKRENDVSDLLQPDKVKLVFVKKDSTKPIPPKEPIKHNIPQKEPAKSLQPVPQIKPIVATPSKTTIVQKIVRKKPEPIKEIICEKKGEEQLRINVRKSLLETLSSRISEESEMKTAEENLEDLISQIEEELYIQFGKVDQKYKTKYRSLMFNIKDPKNLNFFKKIMFKWVTPYQLVRMTADEMASQELAEWRERENKHQIEMIRKTELDMMNQSKTLLMKTHKGEEIIEPKDNKETIVSELNPDIKVQEKKPQILLKLTKEDKKEKKKSRYKERSSSGDRERRHHKSSRSRHKSHKDKKHRSRDRSRSRDKKEKNVKQIKKIEISTDNPVINDLEVCKEEDTSDREPSSTVVIATPPRVEDEISPIWKGIINFTDVARCNVTMTRLSGNVIALDAELNLPVLECVGRIKQQIVWEYMGKLKKTGTKDIIVTKLSAGGMEQQMSYLSLYQYLSAKNRIAVIDSKPFPNIKDFYIYPLGSHCPVPQVLLPLDGPGVDDYRTHLLLGIIVRNSKKSWVPLWKQSENNYALSDNNDTLPLPHLKPALSTSIQDRYSPEESYTPPRSPTNKILSLPTPVVPHSLVLTDDDLPYIPGEEEPYSPVDEDEPSISDDVNTTSSIHQQMEELTRKIEKEKLVIQLMTAENAIADDSLDSDEEVYSPTSELTPLTTKIHLPSNIKDILSSINTKDLNSTDEDISKAAADSEKKCRDPRQRISSVTSVEHPIPEEEFSSPCKPERSLPPPSFPTPYRAPMNYVAPMPYAYPPPGYISDVYPNQYGSQQPPPPPPPPMTMDQSKYNNYNQSKFSYNSVYQPPPPPPKMPYTKNEKKSSGFWLSGSSKNEPKKKRFKKSGDRRDKNSWRR